MTPHNKSQVFPRTEYLRRLAAVRAEMARREVEAVVLFSFANICYLTGHTTRVIGTPQALIVSLREEEPVYITRKMDTPAAARHSFMARSKVVGYAENLMGHPDKDGFDAVVDLVHDLGHASRRLGLEFGQVSGQTAEKLKARLPNAKLADFSKVVDWVRIIKSDLEIEIIREAAAIADAGILRATEVIRPGVREADAAAEIVAALIRGVEDKTGTVVPPMLLCASPNTGTAHIPWSDDVFRQGSQINLELGGIRHRYAAGLMRTFSIGSPSDRLRRIHDAEVAGLDAALATVRPGATCSDVANAFYRTLDKYGFKKESRCGYSIGIEWTEPTASLKDGDMTELRPNMTFHLMLGNWVEEDFGYVISETFRVTDTGVEVLTNTPRKLFELS